MSALRSYLLLVSIFAGGSHASEGRLSEAFAVCAGRYSAELEHAWLMQRDADDILHRRAQFIDLVQALSTPDQIKSALHTRIDAKLAHAQLLTQSAFSHNAAQSDWAARRAARHLEHCAQFLLES